MVESHHHIKTKPTCTFFSNRRNWHPGMGPRIWLNKRINRFGSIFMKLPFYSKKRSFCRVESLDASWLIIIIDRYNLKASSGIRLETKTNLPLGVMFTRKSLLIYYNEKNTFSLLLFIVYHFLRKNDKKVQIKAQKSFWFLLPYKFSSGRNIFT